MAIGEVHIPTETTSPMEKLEYKRREAIVSDIVKTYREWPETNQIINAFLISGESPTEQSNQVIELFPEAARYRELHKMDRARLFEDIDRGVTAYESRILTGLGTDEQTDGQFIQAAAAHDVLVSTNLGLVAKASYDVWPLGANRHDMAQHGVIGLVKSVRLFDSSKKIQFSTYAMYWIKSAMQRNVDMSSVMRISHDVWLQRSKIRTALEDLTAELGRQPSIDEIYREVKGLNNSHRPLSREDVLIQISHVGPAMHPLALNEGPLDDEEGSALIERIADPNSPDPIEVLEPAPINEVRFSEYIKRLIGKAALSPAEQVVATLIADGMTDDEIAEKLDQPKATVQRKKVSIVRKMESYVVAHSVEPPKDDAIYDAA